MFSNPAEIPPPKLISYLRRYNLLPAIVFLPTRRRCDESATEVSLDRSQPADSELQAKRQTVFDEFSIEYPEILTHKHKRALLNSGIASHHAGHIPAWKLIVEKMMSAGLLQAIFATSTVAAGVDFPARTVVVSNADTRGNNGWRPFRASELQQMTGRAGRRGRDNVGFVVLVPGQFQDLRKIAELLRSKPDALESRFRATYTTLLNLLDAFSDLDSVREFTEKSYAFREFRRDRAKLSGDNRAERLGERIWFPFDARARVLDQLGYIDIAAETVSPDGKWLADLRIDRPLIVGEGLRDGAFDEIGIPQLAGVIASVTADTERNYGELRVSRSLDDAITRLEGTIARVANIEWKNGVDVNDELNLSAAAAAEKWAGGIDWPDLVKRTRAEEGDLVRLLSRTGEALRQIGELRHGGIVGVTSKAFAASDAILREPVR